MITKLPTSDADKTEGILSDTPNQTYVRVTKIDNRGFVEFQFSVGDQNLYLEMALPRAAFDEFCSTQQSRHLTAEEERAVDQTELKWRFGDFAEEVDSTDKDRSETDDSAPRQ